MASPIGGDIQKSGYSETLYLSMTIVINISKCPMISALHAKAECPGMRKSSRTTP